MNIFEILSSGKVILAADKKNSAIFTWDKAKVIQKFNLICSGGNLPDVWEEDDDIIFEKALCLAEAVSEIQEWIRFNHG